MVVEVVVEVKKVDGGTGGSVLFSDRESKEEKKRNMQALSCISFVHIIYDDILFFIHHGNNLIVNHQRKVISRAKVKWQFRLPMCCKM